MNSSGKMGEGRGERKLLAVEASTECCSVALRVGGQVFERSTLEPRAHARWILPWARELLAEAGISYKQLDGLVVSRGPGGFTSLRIGLGIVQGIALAHDLPVHPVSSLETLAASADPDCKAERLLTLLDARMGEVYAAWYRAVDGKHERIGNEQLLAPNRLVAPDHEGWLAVGPGSAAYDQQISEAPGQRIAISEQLTWPHATALLRLAESVAPVPGHQLTPVYLRDHVTG